MSRHYLFLSQCIAVSLLLSMTSQAAENLTFPLHSTSFNFNIAATGHDLTQKQCVALYKKPAEYVITKHLGPVFYRNQHLPRRVTGWTRLQQLPVSDTEALWRAKTHDEFTINKKKYNLPTNYAYFSNGNHNLSGIWWNDECQGMMILIPHPIAKK